MRREPQIVMDGSDRLIELASEMGLQLYAALGKTWRGWSQVVLGDVVNGLQQIQQATDARLEGRANVPSPLDMSLIAEANAANGKYESALQTVKEALDVIERTGERYWEAELHRLRGDFLWRQGRVAPREVKDQLWRAITVSRCLGAKALELRGATSLARFMSDAGENEEAISILKPIYDWFTEGFDTPDLKEAKALLDELV